MSLQFGANHFLLTGEKTTIVYFPNKGGPVSPNPDLNGGLLEYRGPEGSQSFVGNDIHLQSGPLGNMVTIMPVTRESTSVSLTLLLPRITLEAGHFVSFETFLVQTRPLEPAEGALVAYSVLALQGTANNVILPH